MQEMGVAIVRVAVAIAMECQRDRLPGIRFRELLPPYEGEIPVKLRFE